MTAPGPRSIHDLLASGEALLLDGGLATQLEAQGEVIDTPLWSAELLLRSPGSIRAAHAAFLEAGAEVLITASYQLSSLGLERLGVDPGQLDELLVGSIRLAQEARRAHLVEHPERAERILVAASVGPYGAARADGSEYRGDYELGAPGLRHFHAGRLATLDSGGADLLACETLPSGEEARVLAELLEDVQTPAWVSFACRDERELCDGTSLHQAAALFAGHPRVVAVGVNCTAPRFIAGAIDELRAGAPDKQVVVYPNSGERFDVEAHAWHRGGERGVADEVVREWRRRGASLIGGCCRMGPADVRAMGLSLRKT